MAFLLNQYNLFKNINENYCNSTETEFTIVFHFELPPPPWNVQCVKRRRRLFEVWCHKEVADNKLQHNTKISQSERLQAEIADIKARTLVIEVPKTLDAQVNKEIKELHHKDQALEKCRTDFETAVANFIEDISFHKHH